MENITDTQETVVFDFIDAYKGNEANEENSVNTNKQTMWQKIKAWFKRKKIRK